MTEPKGKPAVGKFTKGDRVTYKVGFGGGEGEVVSGATLIRKRLVYDVRMATGNVCSMGEARLTPAG